MHLGFGLKGDFYCKKCEKEFDIMWKLMRHYKTEHKKIIIYKCKKCKIKFKTQNGYNKHKCIPINLFCECCKKEIKRKYGLGRFCSEKCARKFASLKNRKAINKKISKTLIKKNKYKRRYCIKCKKRLRKKQRQYCYNCFKKTDKYKQFCKERGKKSAETVKRRGSHAGWPNRKFLSYPEKFFITVLKNNNIFEKCKVNFKIRKRTDLNVKESGNYFLDFYFPELKIDLEIDGKIHTYGDNPKKDRLRDKRLTRNAIKVYRIKWGEINSDKGKLYMKNEIDKFLKFYTSCSSTR